MSIPHIPPAEAARLMAQGALLADIREPDEWRREHILQAEHFALSALDRKRPSGRNAVIFYCRSGNRTTVNAARLAASAKGAKVYLLEGGIEAWRDAGLPTVKDLRQPIELIRQVQIAAGGLTALGVALGAFVHPAWLALPAFVGAGLVFAGATGFCGMARLLAFAPWNRVAGV